MRRRTFAGIAIAGLMAGCASRAPQPRRALPDLQRVGMLPVKEWPTRTSTAPFNFAMLPSARGGGSTLAYGPIGFGAALANSIEGGRDARRRALAIALVPAKFSPRTTIAEHLAVLVQQRGLPIVAVETAPWVEATQDNDEFKSVPKNWDALLDVHINEAGYYPGDRSFVPRVSASVRLIDPRSPAQVAESFDYEVDTGTSNDPRFIPAPPALMLTSVDAIRENAASIRQGMTTLCTRVAEKMADDVERVIRKLPRLG
jgi:hypothetical protein